MILLAVCACALAAFHLLTCQEFLDLVKRWSIQGMTDAELSAMSLHLDDCPACRALPELDKPVAGDPDFDARAARAAEDPEIQGMENDA